MQNNCKVKSQSKHGIMDYSTAIQNAEVEAWSRSSIFHKPGKCSGVGNCIGAAVALYGGLMVTVGDRLKCWIIRTINDSDIIVINPILPFKKQ